RRRAYRLCRRSGTAPPLLPFLRRRSVDGAVAEQVRDAASLEQRQAQAGHSPPRAAEVAQRPTAVDGARRRDAEAVAALPARLQLRGEAGPHLVQVAAAGILADGCRELAADQPIAQASARWLD